MTHTPRVLFVLKHRHQYNQETYSNLPSGLFNSAQFVCEMLKSRGIHTALEQVTDNNGIDSVVTAHRPDIVVLEALWVVPEKFHVLRKLHPNVRWVVRVHSELPFLANEGMAMAWISEYLKHNNVFVAFNSIETYRDFEELAEAEGHKKHKVLFMPNYYPLTTHKNTTKFVDEVLDVGCFGAVRSLKNQLTQAIAAITFAKKYNEPLRFHINATRHDDETTTPVLKNIRELFASLPPQFQLVEHPWLNRPEFLQVVGTMDIGLQVSLTESFNIVTADFVEQRVPVVVSPQIHWVPAWFHADPTSVESIVKAMERAMFYGQFLSWTHWTHKKLAKQVNMNAEVWLDTLRRLG